MNLNSFNPVLSLGVDRQKDRHRTGQPQAQSPRPRRAAPEKRDLLLTAISNSVSGSFHSSELLNTGMPNSPAPSTSLPGGNSQNSNNNIIPTGRTSSFQFSSHGSENLYADVTELRKAVSVELSGSWVFEEASQENPLHQRLCDKLDATHPELHQKVKDWLRNYQGYNNKTKEWKAIPQDQSSEKALYEPTRQIFDDIVVGFHNDKSKEKTRNRKPKLTRKVIITANEKFKHHISDGVIPTSIKSCFDIGIFGTGPSAASELELPEPPSYEDVATPVEIKKDDREVLEVAKSPEVQEQIAVYAREVLVQQPNRNFVRVPLMSGKYMRVAHFDRAGAHVSPAFNYHEEAVTFVKLIWLFSSLNEAEVGYDTSIYWENGTRYIEVASPSVWDPTAKCWIASLGPPRKLKIVPLEGELRPLDPVFFRRAIRSRGTKCWLVEGPNGERFYLKDYWMGAERTPESDLLQRVAGIFGVGQMHLWQNNIATIYAQRCHQPDEQIFATYVTGRLVGNRALMRIVLDRYVGTFEEAETAIELLEATRDVVCGHRDALIEKRVLHGDISFNNLLITENSRSPTPSPNKPKGALIDFDMARFVLESEEGQFTEGNTGTRAFQSVKLLLENALLGAHDNMDDLESVFYVLCYVCLAHDLDGRLLNPLPKMIASWTTTQNETTLANVKKGFLREGLGSLVRRFDGDERKIMRECLNDMRRFFLPRIEALASILEEQAINLESDEPAPEPLSHTFDEARDDEYPQFIALIDASLAKLRALPPKPASTPSSPGKRQHPEAEETPTSSESTSPSSLKRQRKVANWQPLAQPKFRTRERDQDS
ncbi:hypothetical protein MIND_00541700 [Mycena indigotica]|uniref:Fungal-type protein kinase domain-containing protein n=1 Tax=Mycena indigotica TaxID=2126181 RepID=A0A8H6WAB6_9AGAR|nr:uncharacterized protein MIND_00541700 [Mycena indigotica]KAF7307473.1 hypothetical protein MIND_00541700 [Mycena indigotica]